MYQVLWVGAHTDKKYYLRLNEKLKVLDITLNCLEDYIYSGEEFKKTITKVIADSLYVILFISDNLLKSDFCLSEIKYCFCNAKN